jgi:transposase
MRDDTGAARILDDRPKANELLADRGYAAAWFRMALIERGMAPCLPPRKTRKIPLAYDNTRYKQRHKVENMFGRINDWRRVARR